jgi:hypothetical protein
LRGKKKAAPGCPRAALLDGDARYVRAAVIEKRWIAPYNFVSSS